MNNVAPFVFAEEYVYRGGFRKSVYYHTPSEEIRRNKWVLDF